MSRALCKVVYPPNAEIRINDKESPEWVRITTVWEERERIREQVKWVVWIHPLVCERKDVRIKPYELVSLRKYMWTIHWYNWDIDFTIWNISSWWIQVISEKPLKVWELIELSFTLDKNYRFDWKIVWWKWKIYWVQFLVSNNSLTSIQKNYMNLITLLTSVDLD